MVVIYFLYVSWSNFTKEHIAECKHFFTPLIILYYYVNEYLVPVVYYFHTINHFDNFTHKFIYHLILDFKFNDFYAYYFHNFLIENVFCYNFEYDYHFYNNFTNNNFYFKHYNNNLFFDVIVISPNYFLILNTTLQSILLIAEKITLNYLLL